MITYNDTSVAWRDVKSTIESAILRTGAKRILEVGAGANPLFPEEFLIQHQLEYTALDVSSTELDKAPACYRKILANICDDQLDIQGRFDFIFSRMLAEHVPDGQAFHRNVFYLLAPGGRAFHFFPTMWAFPFVLNRLLPERLAAFVLHIIQPGREQAGTRGKFPAYYSWCRGPTSSQISRLERIGYSVDSYTGFFGHRGYYLKFPILLWAHDFFTKWLLANPKPMLTSFAYVTLVKPK